MTASMNKLRSTSTVDMIDINLAAIADETGRRWPMTMASLGGRDREEVHVQVRPSVPLDPFSFAEKATRLMLTASRLSSIDPCDRLADISLCRSQTGLKCR